MKDRGFTVVEVLIIAVATVILLTFIVMLVKATTSKDYNYCDFYRYSTVQDTPVSCFEYLTKERAGYPEEK